ncbi:MAG: penicillin-binding transpeptidase domain-containing protein [Bacillus sp. (in: firmicutes)]
MKNESITLTLGRLSIDLYPDYITYVEEELGQLLAEQNGLSDSLNSDNKAIQAHAKEQVEQLKTELLQSGVIILHPDIQERNQQALQQTLKSSDVEGAAVVIQHHTHELVSLTGAKTYQKYSFHRGYQSFRQPGSAIKPLLVYGPYIDLTGASIHEKVNASFYCKGSYCPKNSGGGNYGFVSLQQAFAKSYNTPAVRLLDKTGVDNHFKYLEVFDFKKITEADYRLASALGGFTYGMSPLLTGAYTSFHEGYYQPPRAIRNITTKDGQILYSWDDQQVQVSIIMGNKR